MAVEFDWMDEHQDIMLVVVSGDWDWDELHTAHSKYAEIVEATGKRVDFIFDITAAKTTTPPGALANIQSLTKRANQLSHWGLSILVMPNVFHRSLMSLFMKLYPGFSEHYRVTSKVEEAQATIAEDRKSQ